MSDESLLRPADLDRLRALDTCRVSNAIERLDARLRNEGFVIDTVQCLFPHFAPMLGHAATGRIRTAAPPMTGQRCYYDRLDWWTYVASIPEPRVIVLEDVDHKPGVGAFVGEVHASIARALNCVGCVTNGAVRDLAAVEALSFHLFAGSVAVSHSYAHITEFGEPVEIGGLRIGSGDLLHGDRHGVLTIPLSIAAEIPAEVARMSAEERELIEFCRSSEFSLEELDRRIHRMPENCEPGQSPGALKNR